MPVRLNFTPSSIEVNEQPLHDCIVQSVCVRDIVPAASDCHNLDPPTWKDQSAGTIACAHFEFPCALISDPCQAYFCWFFHYSIPCVSVKSPSHPKCLHAMLWLPTACVARCALFCVSTPLACHWGGLSRQWPEAHSLRSCTTARTACLGCQSG